jgi:hypothetical protein
VFFPGSYFAYFVVKKSFLLFHQFRADVTLPRAARMK